MEEVYGWAGKILKINLTNGKITEEPTLPKYRSFIGGLGIGYKVMWDEVPPETDPYDPENRIVFAIGPLVGSEAPGATRTIVVSKSPQCYEHLLPSKTETSHSAFGGPFGPELKYSGYDAIVIWGKSDEPVYLYVHDDGAELRDADKLWGLGAIETGEKIKEELEDPNVQVAAIGQAGEKLVRFATIVHRGYGDHAAGQGGFGAVMGSKKLKAIAVRSERGMAALRIAKPKEFAKTCSRALRLISAAGVTTKSDDYVKGVNPYLASNFLQWRRQDSGKSLCPSLMKYRVGRTGCCPFRCYDIIHVPGVGMGYAMCIQYVYCWVGKPGPAAFVAKMLGDEYGINFYELYLMIPWLISLWMEKVITEEETGIPFSKYPDREFIETLLRKIAFREGFGDFLAEGTARASERLGVLDKLLNEELSQYMPIQAEKIIAWCSYGGHCYCGHYDPRDLIVNAIQFAVSSRDPHDYMHDYVWLTWWSNLTIEEQRPIAKVVYGSEKAVHPYGQPEYSRDEAWAAHLTDCRGCIKDSLTLCDWIFPVIVTPYRDRNPPYVGDTSIESQLFSAATGIFVTEWELYKIGERINNLMRAVMVREMGVREMREKHDTLPEHFFKNPSPQTRSPPVDREKFEKLKMMYYEIKGWDKNGLPTRSKLEELGLKEVADELERLGLLGEE